MDWRRVRAELTALRHEQRPKMSQTRLGKAAGFSKSTVTRIENVYAEPEHVPDLDTIERWLACGVKLSDFSGGSRRRLLARGMHIWRRQRTPCNLEGPELKIVSGETPVPNS
jgi:transcriptional regulator with XRE-family HTH domain